MKKLNENEMKSFNGGWKYSSDRYLPIKDYKKGDERQYSGTYSTWGGTVTYIVYYRPGVGKFRTA